MLFNQLSDDPARDRCKLQLFQAALRNDLLDQVAHSCGVVVTRSALPSDGNQLGQAVGDKVMLVGSLLSDYSFDENAKSVSVTTSLGFDEVK